MAMQVQRNPTEMPRRPVTFTAAELWLLHDFIRHEMPDANSWRYPPASRDLNEQIVFALEACESCELEEYSLLLSRGDILAIDFFVRRDHKTPEGASGKAVLMKVFKARKELAMGMNIADIEDKTYKEVNANAGRHRDTGQDAD